MQEVCSKKNETRPREDLIYPNSKPSYMYMYVTQYKIITVTTKVLLVSLNSQL